METVSAGFEKNLRSKRNAKQARAAIDCNRVRPVPL